MSKYIIDTDQFEKLFETKAVAVLGIGDNLAVPEEGEKTVWTRMLNVADLEELNSDYINEHFGDLQDTAYKKGLEEGKAQAERGCKGCEYEGKTGEHLPCEYCKNNFRSQWTAKDDEIEVGDEVNWLGDCFIVTRIFQPRNMKEQCDGIDDDGCVYSNVLIDGLEKTGRHFDIQSVLEEMRHD